MEQQHASHHRAWDSPHQPQGFVSQEPAMSYVQTSGLLPQHDPLKVHPHVEQYGAPHQGTQQVQQESKPPASQRKRPFWSWTWEMVSVLLCIGLIGAIFAILATYNGQRVPDWGLSINLSTLMALLATILRASLVMIAAEVISQAKWSWFSPSGQQFRPLSQLQAFDAASRGAFGAAHLIPTVLLKSPVALVAAIITIVSFATGPFVQQAIKTVNCNEIVPTSRASVPIAHYAPGSSGYVNIGTGLWEVMNDMKGALIAGLSNPSTVNTNIVSTCPTGNCTFLDYASIGLCSYCKDITPLVTGPHFLNATIPAEFRLPNGASISMNRGQTYLSLDPTDNMTWIGDFPTDYAWALLNFTVLSAKDDPSTSSRRCKDDNSTCAYTASACAIFPCMRIYSASVSSGLFTETPLSSIPVFPDLTPQNLTDILPPVYPPLSPRAMQLSAIQTPCHLDGTTYTTANISTAPSAIPLTFFSPNHTPTSTSAPIECIHRIYDIYAFALARFLRELLSGTCSHGGRQAGILNCRQPGATQFDAFWLDAFFHNWTATPEKIASTVETLALAGTNKLRLTGKTANVENNALSETGTTGDFTEGEVWTVGVCTEVDWRWLVLPAVLVGLTVLVLGLAVVGSWRGPVWKASVLPVVFYGGRFVTREGEAVRAGEGEGVMGVEVMEKMAGGVEVRLDVGGDAERERGTGRRADVDVDSLLLREGEPGVAR
ncbi:hypothetical protein QBC34DRAFT_348174 [Podospora aff. communis PSN243]|uniref:Uncharacterized protein n=1 Tax=Podospora aff. communis PSN243 TaxID=3040156 RepID=A0AAV9GSC2_9PEZI|nr:hypothetical protein QBC34DRAFT_348174 [Podospora aff. communis PSN243]